LRERLLKEREDFGFGVGVLGDNCKVFREFITGGSSDKTANAHKEK